MKRLLPTLLLATLGLTGCGESSSTTAASSAAETRITGLVLDDETPVTQARIEAADRNGKVVAGTELGGDAHYRLALPPGTAFPVVLSARIDGVAEPLKAAVTSDLVSEQDISPVTTLVVNTALKLGGLSEANLAKATGAAISQRKSTGGSGGSAGFKGDPTKQYGGWH